jgi:putative transcriptional regulator
MFHYTSCGLQNVWLANGYRRRRTPHGEAVAIENVEGLHKAIAGLLVSRKPRLSGAEFRYLRKELGLSQAKLAHVLGNDAQSVALWEKRGRVPKWADRFLRAVWREVTEGNAHIMAMVERLNDLDETEHKRLTFEETPKGWQEKAAA